METLSPYWRKLIGKAWRQDPESIEIDEKILKSVREKFRRWYLTEPSWREFVDGLGSRAEELFNDLHGTKSAEKESS